MPACYALHIFSTGKKNNSKKLIGEAQLKNRVLFFLFCSHCLVPLSSAVQRAASFNFKVNLREASSLNRYEVSLVMC